MKRGFILLGVALAGVCTAHMGARAMPQYKDVVVKAHKPNTAAVKALSCVTCHVSASNFGRNLYGKQIEKEMGGKKGVTVAVLEKIAALDADEDGTTNEAEIKAGTNPGDPKSGARKDPPAEK